MLEIKENPFNVLDRLLISSLKSCRVCKQEKSLKNFPTYKAKLKHEQYYTFRGLCTICFLYEKKLDRIKNKEQIKILHANYYAKNKEILNKKAAIWRKKDPEKTKANNRRKHLRVTYNLTIEDFENLMLLQNGVCKICKQINVFGRHLAIDHCHKTGKIRGLLCNPCNQGLGAFRDDLERMQNAINYLKENN